MSSHDYDGYDGDYGPVSDADFGYSENERPYNDTSPGVFNFLLSTVLLMLIVFTIIYFVDKEGVLIQKLEQLLLSFQ
jgi:hypothetical protein